MFTLKLYQGSLIGGRTVIIETCGVWVDMCEGAVQHVRAFKKEVGVMDANGTPEFYVGGDLSKMHLPADGCETLIAEGRGGNYFSWGVLENSQGKTTQVLR